MIDEVYRVRTEPGYKGDNPLTDKQHWARKGSLVVIWHKCQDGVLFGFAPNATTGEQENWNFRPCDLKRLEFHEEINH